MSKTVLNLALDMLAGLLFLAMIFTGFIIKFPLPPATNKSLMLWNHTRHEYGLIHYWISIALLSVLLLHLILHWQWVTSVIGKKMFGISTDQSLSFKAGIAMVIIVLISFSLFAFTAYHSVKDFSASAVCAQGPINSISQKIGEQTKVDFWKDVYPIFENNCINCHGPRKQFGGFRADIRDDYFSASGKPIIIPGKSSESILIKMVSGKQPINSPGHLLSAAEVELLSKWIDEGANWPE